MRKIALLNQKGGVGKTTTVANLGACLARLGKTVLLLDTDPQANLSIHYGVSRSRGGPSIYTVLSGEHSAGDVLEETMVENLHLIPSSIDLAGLEMELSQIEGKELKLRRALEPVARRYDYVLLDCPPSLGLLSVNSMCAADEIFIPLQTEFFALQGLGGLLQIYELVRSTLNPDLVLSGIIACMVDSRTSLALDVLQEIRDHFGDKVFRTLVRKNVRLAEAPGYGLPVVLYDEDCHGAEDYASLALEVVGMERREADMELESRAWTSPQEAASEGPAAEIPVPGARADEETVQRAAACGPAPAAAPLENAPDPGVSQRGNELETLACVPSAQNEAGRLNARARDDSCES